MSSSEIPVGKAEAVPEIEVTLLRTMPNGSVEPKKVYFEGTMKIEGLKGDCQSLFNIPVMEQVWMFKNEVLSNDRSLVSYGIQNKDQINVKKQGDN